MKTFPTVLWGDMRATFLPTGADLPAAPITAALVFAMQDGEFVLADIAGRGWCIPGGRLETGENAEQAVRREAHEEIGASLGPLRLLGYYLLTPASASEAIPGGTTRSVEDDAQSVLVPHTHHPVPDTRLVTTYLADVTALIPLPSGTESQGVRRVRREELRACYYTWDALLEAMFAYAWAHHKAAL
jgi:8-oxo-dGTP diphosphatase